MECYSLLDSYGHVVYENKKKFEKKFSENIFSSDEKNSDLGAGILLRMAKMSSKLF